MRNRFFSGLTILLTLVLCFQPVLPLFAADGLSFRILQPLPEETITGSTLPIACAFQSAPDAPVVRVDVYLDSQWLVGGRVTEPIPTGSFRIDSADFSDLKVHPGRHTLYIKLFTNQGAVVQHEQHIIIKSAATLNPTTIPPTVRILKPTDGMQLAARTTVQIDASADCGIAWVEVYLNGKRFAMMNEAPFQIPLDPIADRLQPGTYTLTARAIDIFNNEATSAPIKIIVGSPYGHTQIQQELAQPVNTDLISLLPVASLALPSGGSGFERQPFSNLVTPLASWSDAGSLLPNILAAESRFDPATMPSMDALALLPVKSVPEQEAVIELPMLTSQGITSTPALSALPSMISPMSAATSSLTPTRGLLLVPVTESPLSAGVKDTMKPGSPVVAIPIELNAQCAKFAPATGKAISAEAATFVIPTAVLPPAHGKTATGTVVPVQRPKALSTAVASVQHAQAPAVKSNRPVLLAKAPILGDARSSTAAPAIAEMHAASGENGRLSHEMPSLPSPGIAVAARTLPAAGTSPALGRVLMTKAVPGANTAQTEGDIVLFTPVRVECAPDTASRSHAVKTSPAQSKYSIELRAPYTIKTGDTLVKIARAYSTTPDELAKLNPGLSPNRPLVTESRIVVPQPDAHIYLDNRPITGAPQPYTVRGFSLVPFRKIVEAKHGVVIWIPKTHEVNAWVNQTFMGLTIDSRTARINGDIYLLPVAATLHESRTMVPLRYVAAALDLQIEFNANTGTYYLISRATP